MAGSSVRTQIDSAAAGAAAWLRDHGDALFRFALGRTGSPEVAEELVQETLLAAMTAARAFEGRASVRTWLIAILKRKIIDERRRSAHRAGGGEASASEDLLARFVDAQFDRRGIWKGGVGSWGRTPGSDSEREELRQALARCLEKLPPRASEVFLLAERQEYSAEEIGKICGLSTTNVGVIIYRARMALRHCLETTWFARP